MAVQKAFHEGFARFFEAPSREALRDLLKHSVGETDHIDFKAELPEKAKLAKHFLAFANSGGGALIVGVTDGELMEPVGISQLTDKADIQKMVSPYLPDSLQYEVFDFSFTESEYPTIKGKTFQAILIESNDKDLPYVCKRNGDSIRENVLYVRKGTNSTEANHDDFQKVINKRLDTGYSSTRTLSLEEHLEQLKLLYKEIPRTIKIPKEGAFDQLHAFARIAGDMQNLFGKLYETKPNPEFPSEDYDTFVLRLIDMKKARIKQEIEV